MRSFALSLFVAAVITLVAGSLSAGATTAPALAPATPVPQFGTDLQVNPIPTATPATQKNFSIAVSPTNPNLVISGYDNEVQDNPISAYATSTDAGRTWA